MQKLTKFLKSSGAFLLAIILVFTSLPVSLAAQENENKHEYHATGVRPLTEEEQKWKKENMIETKKVLPNKIGLERANQVRKKKGLKQLDINKAVKIGEEVIGKNDSQVNTITDAAAVSDITALAEISQPDLPSYVDNSQLPFFPPIRSQGGLNSCASFSTTYYQATYMNAMARDWSTKDDSDNSNKFSPEWTYNFINYGRDNGSNQIGAYKLFLEQGIATWGDWPYIGDSSDPKNYLEWPTNPQVWRNASGFRADKVGYVQVQDGTRTPVSNEQDDTLTSIKQLLANGYVLNCTTDIFNWCYMPISDNPYSTADDILVGRAAGYMVDSRFASNLSHAMTIVGYCDDVWVDIDGDGSIDAGEKGAFKIANSWGNTWGVDPNTGNQQDGDGYIWFCYDALNGVSAIDGLPAAAGRKEGWGLLNEAYWITAKTSNTPPLLAEITVSHPKRNQLKCELGYSEAGQSTPAITWESTIPYTWSGDCSFDGTNQVCDGTLVFDYGNLILGKDLSQTAKKWYIRITDSTLDENQGIIKSFKLIDPSSGTETSYPITSYPEVNGSSVTLGIEYNLSSQNNSTSPWSYKKDIGYNINYRGLNLVSTNDKIYMIGENGNDNTKCMLLEYDPLNDNWSLIDDNFPKIDPQYSKAVVLNGKIYYFPEEYYYAYAIKKLYVYDIATRQCSRLSDLPVLRSHPSIVEYSGKIYVIDSFTYDTPGQWVTTTSSVLEYDPAGDIWTVKPNTDYPINVKRSDAAAITANGKIYVLGGYNPTNTAFIETVEAYDPISDRWSSECSLPDDIIRTCNTFEAVSINNKIYLFTIGQDMNRIYEFDPVSNVWTEKTPIPRDPVNFGVQETGGKIYVVPAYSHSVLEYDPLRDNTEAQDRVAIPSFSPAGGTYYTPQTVTISSATTGAAIRYTMDGTAPTSSSSIYTGPITVQGDMTLRAIATKSGMLDSYISTAEFKIVPKVAAPVISPAGGIYRYPQKVTLSCEDTGATIRYTLDGTIPTSSSPVYTESIIISGNTTVKAAAFKTGMLDSDIAGASYSTPLLIGDVDGSKEIDILDYATLQSYVLGNITDLPVEDDLWAGDLDGDGLINSIDSGILHNYILNNIEYFPKEQPSAPVGLAFQSTSPESVSITWDESTGLSDIEGYDVYRDGAYIGSATDTTYTDTGLTPNTTYTYTVTAKMRTVNPRIPSEDRIIPSSPSSPLEAVINIKAAAPTFSPAGGTYSVSQSVAIQSATAGATIRYTTDGSTPTSSSSIYSGPIDIPHSMTIKAIAVKDGMADSDVSTASYTINIPNNTLKLECFNNQRDASVNNISPRFRLTNTGTEPVNLSDIKIRYYYSIDGEQGQNFYCDYSSIGSSNVLGSFVKMDIPKTNADYYLEISFTSGAGTLAPGSTLEEVQVRFAKQDWTNYTQTNDYSFNSSASSYVEWNKVALYKSGTLVWGIEP